MSSITRTEYSEAATEAVIQKVAAALAANNIEAIVAADGDEARRLVLERLPAGASVHSGKSATMEAIGITAALTGGDYDWIRDRTVKMDRATQADEIRRLVSTPDFMLGSAQAITEDGVMAFASYSGSQIGPLVGGARRVILVIGSQKIVPDLAAAQNRVREHVFPYEDTRLREQLGVPTKLAKLLFSYLEPAPGRTTVILVREPVGI
jgi:hypothetical protein